MKIVVLNPYPFPKGMAPTTRMRSYCKGLASNSVEVEVVCFFPKTKEFDNEIQGQVDGYKWHYIQDKNYQLSKVQNMMIERPKVLLKTLGYIRNENRHKKIDFVLLSFDDPYLLLFFTWGLRLLGIRVAFIGDEYPKQIRLLKEKVPIWDVLLFKLSHSFMSCRILMTGKLIDYYNQKVCKLPSYLLGSILDKDRFVSKKSPNSNELSLCYMGNMQLRKDNVDNIVEAFSLIADEFPSLKLYLYGNPSSVDCSKVKKLIEQKHLQNRAVLMGRVDYIDVPEILSRATILVTSQPNTKRAEGGFPTKMGEYMMTHVPMLVTDVGEISQYVQDGVTTFMVPPSNPQAYADKIKYILNHPEISEDVANRAYDYACQNYECSSVAKGLASFLTKL